MGFISGFHFFRSHAVDHSFTVSCMHQKVKTLFCCINVDFTTKFVKKCFSFYFFSFEYKERKEKFTLNLIVFKIYFNAYLIKVIYFMNFMSFDFIFKFLLLHNKVDLRFKLFTFTSYFAFKNFFPSFKANLHLNGGKWFPGKWSFFAKL